MIMYIIRLLHSEVVYYVSERLSEFEFKYDKSKDNAMKMPLETAEEISQLLSYADFYGIVLEEVSVC